MRFPGLQLCYIFFIFPYAFDSSDAQYLLQVTVAFLQKFILDFLWYFREPRSHSKFQISRMHDEERGSAGVPKIDEKLFGLPSKCLENPAIWAYVSQE